MVLVSTSPRAEDRCRREWCSDGEAGPEPISTDPVDPAPGVVGGQGTDGQRYLNLLAFVGLSQSLNVI